VKDTIGGSYQPQGRVPSSCLPVSKGLDEPGCRGGTTPLLMMGTACGGESEGEPDEAGRDDWIGDSEVRFSDASVDAAGQTIIRQKLSRSRMLELFAKVPRRQVGIEACASSHYWAGELIRFGLEGLDLTAAIVADTDG
jgi:hypothetical protein